MHAKPETTEFTNTLNTGAIAAPSENDSAAQLAEKGRQAAALVTDVKVTDEKGAGPKGGDSALVGMAGSVIAQALGVGGVTELLGGIDARFADKHETSSQGAVTMDDHIKQSFTKKPGLNPIGYDRAEPKTLGTYGGDPHSKSFASAGASLVASVNIAGGALRDASPKDTFGLVNASTKKNLDGMDTKGSEEITAKVQAHKQQSATLRAANEAVLSSVHEYAQRNQAKIAQGMGLNPGMAPPGPSMSGNQFLADAKRVSEWDNPDRWRGTQS